MAIETATTWICDRCGVRAPEQEPGWGGRPVGWTQLNGLDLCDACRQSFCDWKEATRKTTEPSE